MIENIITKIVGIICVSLVSYKLATMEEGPLKETHPYLAVFLELGAIYFIFY